MSRTEANEPPVDVLVTGATGRMAGEVISEAKAAEGVGDVVGVSRSPDVDDVEGVPVEPAEDLSRVLDERGTDVLVDFTVPSSSVSYVGTAAEAGVACVVGTTGFDEADRNALAAAGEEVPVLRSANFAPGVQALLDLVGDLARMLPEYDVEVTETYHNDKRDAPSGTVTSVLDRIAENREDAEPVFGREGDAPRDPGEVGVHARRAGDVTGENQVLFGGNHEVLTVTQRAGDRRVFAAGAVSAAVAVADEPPGTYEFSDLRG